MNKPSKCFIGGALILAIAGTARAENCTITEDPNTGTIVVKTSAGREIRALNDEGKRKILQQATELTAAKADLATARSEIEELKKQVAALDQLSKGGDSLLAKQKDYIGDLEHSLNGYRTLADDYRKQARGPETLTLEAGVGATGGDTKPALLLGAGVRRFRIWGFFQENNTGALVGIQFPLF